MNREGELLMKKVVPFKKEIEFKTTVSEITSISLEHNLHIEDNNLITGNFIVSGEYKMADTSVNTDAFSFELPFDINFDSKYDLSSVNVDIDDFYYEIVNNRSLEVNIEVLIDKLVEKPLMEMKEENKSLDEVSNILENEILLDDKKEDDEIMERCIEKEDILSEFEVIDDEIESDKIDMEITNSTSEVENKIDTKVENKSIEKINSLFDNLDASVETYKTYKVCIIRTGDTIESVLQKYSISKEELEKYNNLTDIKIGDKLIIPSITDAKV